MSQGSNFSPQTIISQTTDHTVITEQLKCHHKGNETEASLGTCIHYTIKQQKKNKISFLKIVSFAHFPQL